MEDKLGFTKIEELIVRDQKLLFTFTSYIMILIVYINQSINPSPLIGATATIVYFFINTVFVGKVFFREEDLFLRFALGSLLLIVLLGLVAWAIMIIYNLDIVRSAVVLCIVTALCSLSNKRTKPKNVKQ